MYKKARRIPTIIGILILIIGIGGGIFLIENRTSSQTSADITLQPQSVQITNLADSSFSVAWLTQKPVSGSVVLINTDGSEQIVFDDRDAKGESKDYLTHHVTIRNLTPETKYQFILLSGSKKFFDANNKNYMLTTPSKSTEVLSLEPAYGEVVTSKDQPATGALVIIYMPRGLPLSTTVKSSGNWLVPLNIARGVDLKPYSSASPIILSVSVYASTLEEDQARATTDTDSDSPVPVIKLGKSYNFRAEDKPEKTDPVIAQKSNDQILGTTSSNKEKSNSFAVLSPEENARFVSTKPLFRGTGIAGKEVLIEILTPKKISGKTTVSESGTWFWTTPVDLPTDKNTVRISSVDASAKKLTVERSFVVFKSGTQVLGESTPSASLTPTPTTNPLTSPTRTPTPTIAIGSPATPSATLTPTPDEPTPTTKIPVSGSGDLTMMFVSLGATLVIAGIGRLIYLR